MIQALNHSSLGEVGLLLQNLLISDLSKSPKVTLLMATGVWTHGLSVQLRRCCEQRSGTNYRSELGSS